MHLLLWQSELLLVGSDGTLWRRKQHPANVKYHRPLHQHALGCLQYPVKCNLSVRVRLLVLKREMAHLPDDSLPSQFDVVVDGTGQEKSCLSLSTFLGF